MEVDMQSRFRNRASVMVFSAAAMMLLGGCESFYAPLDVCGKVEVDRYTGRWYEIARYPNSFETGCAGVTADYTLQDDGRIGVVNTCLEGGLDGTARSVDGVARVVDPTTNAKLAVSFFPPFEGAYWILELGEDYEYAVVGEPARNFLWILSREPTLDEAVFDGILSRLPEKEYDPNRLEMVLQSQAME